MINLRTAKAFRTTSNEALCIVADTTPILLQTAEEDRIQNLKKGRGNQTDAIDREVELKNRQHPAHEVKILEGDEYTDKLIQVYTDGSKNRQGVGSGVALYTGKDLNLQEKFKLDDGCSNNQAEQLAITKGLEALKKLTSYRTPSETLPSSLTVGLQ